MDCDGADVVNLPQKTYYIDITMLLSIYFIT
ncbi:unknown [Fusobacterium sp. CAG:439]|nr:unknown [Fusobacterium sp. CAG:439]